MNGTNGTTNGTTNGVKSPKPSFPAEATSKEYAISLDKSDPLRSLRDEFIIPSKANLASKKLAKPGKPSLKSKEKKAPVEHKSAWNTHTENN